jgi:hypothetical protein
LGSFVAISGQKPWPSAGCFVAAYGQFFMAADTPHHFYRETPAIDWSKKSPATLRGRRRQYDRRRSCDQWTAGAGA